MAISSKPAGRIRTQIIIWSVGLLATATMLGLGLWQMSRFRSQGQEALVARMHEPARPLAEAVSTNAIPKDAYGRTLTTTGTLKAGLDLLIPDSKDPSHCRVLTPLVTPNGMTVPVVRGVSPTCNSTPVATDPVTLEGVFLPSEAGTQRELPPGQLDTVRLPRLAQEWPGPLAPGFLNLDESHATRQGLEPAPVKLPSGQGQARNNGYAIQWWLFAAAAVAATVKLSRDARRRVGFMAPKSTGFVDNTMGNPTATGDSRATSDV